MDRREPLIFIVSGETSGDNLAGRLMGALKRKTAAAYASPASAARKARRKV